MDTNELNHLLDKTKTAVFLGANSAFLGSLMCQLKEFIWDESIPTAAVGENLHWNPTWFLNMSESCRKTVLLHELWHLGRLHSIRLNGRDPELWNEACDHVINIQLKKEGYDFTGLNPLLDTQYDGLCEEEIYDRILKKKNQSKKSGNSGMPMAGKPGQNGGKGIGQDIMLTSPQNATQQIAQVVSAIQQAQRAGQAGTLPGAIESVLKDFLDPVLPWEQLLYRFMEELTEEDRSWRKRSRRFPDIYMPGIVKEMGGLSHLAYFLDVSGSISNQDILRFNSELKYIKEEMKPDKLSVIQFDTRIQKVDVFTEEDCFDEIKVVGRGGTSLDCVHAWIEKHRPTAAIIFTDMQCSPMDYLSSKIPVMWIITNYGGHTPAFGDCIRIPPMKKY